MTRPHPRDFKKLVKESLGNKPKVDFVVQVGEVFKYLCESGMNSYPDPKTERLKGHLIRENTINALPQLLERFEANARKNGINVLWAEDGKEACDLVLDLARRHEVRLVVKGKSMISEEIGLNEALQEAGVEVHEGDLGEFLVQKKRSVPYHLVGPAIDMSVQEIAEVLGLHIGMPYTEKADEIAGSVRMFLRGRFEKADMGITGVNFAVADSGSLILVENEGNIRWTTTAPRIHVALMSLEKVVDNLRDALHLLGLLTRSCTGQAITSYVSIINGPRKAEDEDGPDEVHVIIIDNGRSRLYAHPVLRQILACMRCGRCGTQCPVYIRIGAYPYGWCYPGPIGTMLMPMLIGVDDCEHLFFACTLCGECERVCPAGVKHLDVYHCYREMKVEGEPSFGATPVARSQKRLFSLWAMGMKNHRLYKTGLILLRRYLKKREQDGYIRELERPMSGWFAGRDLKSFPETSFREWWQKRSKSAESMEKRGCSQ